LGDDDRADPKSAKHRLRRTKVHPPASRDEPDVDRPRRGRQRAAHGLAELVRVGPGVDQDLVAVRGPHQDGRPGPDVERVDMHPSVGLDQQQGPSPYSDVQPAVWKTDPSAIFAQARPLRL
jgi:hypothetical protein